jgi:hypothetical protein
MAYFIMKCYPGNSGAVLSNEPELAHPFELWNGGERFDSPVPVPLQYSIDEEDAGKMPPLFDTGAHLLMRQDLVTALHECGVHNIDVYEAIILDLKSGNRFDNYRAVNIVGLVRAANMSRSIGEDIGLVNDGLVTVWFDKLVLDESKIHNILLFRLAESVSTIIVHDSVKDFLLKRGFNALTFTRPEDL